MAYTKYSLTPANNNAAPPDGAPEGMLPSAVNDTMRDMMAQIRDVGDGIRGGTYTMTAPVITGGSITGVALSGNTLTNPVITGGSINNTPIGASTANTGAFTTIGATGVATFSAGTVSAPSITTTGDTNTGIFFPAADTIAFTEGGVESMRIDSAGNVLVGTSGAIGKLAVVSPSSGYSFVMQGRSSDGQSIMSSMDRSGTVYTGNLTFPEDGSILFGRLNTGTQTERMRIDSSGNLLVGITSARANAGDVQVSKGISFPATQSASSDANTLDDYEEGTFTPTFLNVTATYAFQNAGLYVKIGRQVFVSLVVTTSALTRNGNGYEVGNLPFPVSGSNEAFAPPSLFPETGNNPAGGAGNMYGLFVASASFVRLYTITSSSSDNYVTMTYNDLQTGNNRIRIAGCYLTDN